MANAADGMLGDYLPHKKSCRCEDCQLDRATSRIAELERQLAEANDRYVLLTDELWHIFGEQDRRDYAVQAKEIMEELVEARKAATWTPITPENLPRKSNDEFYVAILTDSHLGMTNRLYPYDVVSKWYLNAMPQLYTHFRPINPPAPEGRKPCGSAS